jgi:hypothetical protein
MVRISRNIDNTVKNKQVKIDARTSYIGKLSGKFPPVKISGNFPSLPVTDGAIVFCYQVTFAAFVNSRHISESDFADVTTKESSSADVTG